MNSFPNFWFWSSEQTCTDCLQHLPPVLNSTFSHYVLSCATLWIFVLLFLHASVAVWCSGKHGYVSLRKPKSDLFWSEVCRDIWRRKFWNSVQFSCIYITPNHKNKVLYIVREGPHNNMEKTPKSNNPCEQALGDGGKEKLFSGSLLGRGQAQGCAATTSWRRGKFTHKGKKMSLEQSFKLLLLNQV